MWKERLFTLIQRVYKTKFDPMASIISLDLHPNIHLERLINRLSFKASKISLSNYLRKNGRLNAVKASCREFLSEEDFRDPKILGRKIKSLVLKTQKASPLKGNK